MLRQNLELYDSYQRQIGTCDGEIESLLQDVAAKHALPGTALPPARRRQRHKNAPRFEIRSPLHQLSGVDLTQIDAIGPYTALRLIAEIGTDMTRWPSEKHFTSWLTLAPKNKITGGRLISSRTMPSANRAAAMLRMCAMSAGKTSTALGAFYRRLAYRIGKAKAITATARKLAILVYRVLRGDIDYADPGVEAYEAQHRSRTLRNLRNRAQRLGLGLIDLETGELMDPGVSQEDGVYGTSKSVFAGGASARGPDGRGAPGGPTRRSGRCCSRWRRSSGARRRRCGSGCGRRSVMPGIGRACRDQIAVRRVPLPTDGCFRHQVLVKRA